MKGPILRLVVGSLALAIGIAFAWATGIFQKPFPNNGALESTEVAPVKRSVEEKSGKVVIRFRDFERGKGWTANFEITNETAQPVFYVGSKDRPKSDYCTLAVKHEEPFPANPDGKIDNLGFKVRYVCYYGTYLTLQLLNPGESIVLSADESEVRSMLNIKDATQVTKAQIGFEMFVGEERHREILWSEEITFPPDEFR